ncbi:MAG TPA: DNA-binding domain-containing protein [Polyangia bacterium]|nr:DNA-binding domain-containing protein [Polyangia bacterium]
MKLAEVQARFYSLATARESVAAAVAAGGPEERRALEEMVAGDQRLSAVARLEIYADMYFARIRDVLAEEYPKTLAALGAAAFQELVADYLDACRPNHPSLREVGARLPAFLAAHAAAAERPWVAELAALERARLELFDGPDAEPLTVEALRARPPETFATLPLRLIPSHAVLSTRFDVAAIWRADDAAAEAPGSVPSTLIVWRHEGQILHRAADAEETSWLRRLGVDEVMFGVLCAALATDRTDEAAAARAYELLGRWSSDGLLRGG